MFRGNRLVSGGNLTDTTNKLAYNSHTFRVYIHILLHVLFHLWASVAERGEDGSTSQCRRSLWLMQSVPVQIHLNTGFVFGRIS